MSHLWTVEALLAATGGTLEGSAPAGVTGIAIDSRTVAPGEAFFAIRGDRFDGHDFAAQALGNGASLAVISASRRDAFPADAGPCVLVEDDPLDALARLGMAARARTDARIIAVTGSVGKTGTKEMLKAALAPQGAVHAPVGSFNNHWGVPLTLARMPEATAFGIFEIGMNHSGEIRPLTTMVRPHAAVVTTVETVHAEHFDSVEGIAEAKAEILEGLEPDGAAILNRDNPWFDLLATRAAEHGARLLSFGADPASDMRLDSLKMDESGTNVGARLFDRPLDYRLGAPGRHLVQNSLAVLAAVDAVGGDVAAAAEALAGFRAPKGRGERFRLQHPDGPVTLIDESYNANPASMRAALALLAQAAPGRQGRRIAVIGDMLELGDDAPRHHGDLLSPLVEARADLAFLVGPLMTNLWNVLPDRLRGAYAASAEELEPILAEALRPGDAVMVKASFGTRLGPVVEGLKRRFAPTEEGRA